jgi:hypothetical protein
MNSKNPSDLEQAYQALRSDMDAIGKVLGKPANGASPVDQYPDLKGKVDEGMLDEESAAEIARLRAAEKLNVASQQHQQEQTSQQRADRPEFPGEGALRGVHCRIGGRFRCHARQMGVGNPAGYCQAAGTASRAACAQTGCSQFNSTHGSQPGLCTDAEGAGFCSRSYQYVA